MNNYTPYTTTRSSLMTKVFGWQSIGLLISGLVAFTIASSPLLIKAIILNKIIMYGLIFAQLGLVLSLGRLAQTGSYKNTLAMYLCYSFLTGITISTIFLLYTMNSIAMCFGITAGMFGIMTLYGYVTNADLSGFGNIMMMGVVGIIIASIVNMFMQNETTHYVISFVAVLLFTGLTAYDVQKIKNFSYMVEDSDTMNKIAVLGALTLYLDFLNIFLHLLSLLGNRRRN